MTTIYNTIRQEYQLVNFLKEQLETMQLTDCLERKV